MIAPTLYVSDYYKGCATTPTIRGQHVQRLNKIYLTISLIIAITSVMISYINGFAMLKQLVLLIYPVYLVSRCNEIFMAFVKDVFDKLNHMKRNKNGLEYFERIQLALRSYIELVLNYATIYYLLDIKIRLESTNAQLFNRPLQDMLDAIYFSVMTIVSVGYGDIYPTHPLSKILVMYEVVNGMLLLVVSFTVYVSLTLDE